MQRPPCVVKRGGHGADNGKAQARHGTVHLPTLFSNSFSPTALLAPALSLASRMNYGDTHSPHAVLGGGDGGGGNMRVSRPTIGLPLDELLDEDGKETPLNTSPRATERRGSAAVQAASSGRRPVPANSDQ
ncbi:hypothetical protein GGX14DRAFT_677870 [Mycena pura]|uniref:Uncharacterized protein n=1 Tax=Mycena pura TaxID=153505 RepID=A0AAD6Y1J9_9AGAR|nr:hypothetical protein GGX14DRAFT_677870 [Mycena pura]